MSMDILAFQPVRSIQKTSDRLRLWRDYTAIVEQEFLWSKGYASFANAGFNRWDSVTSSERFTHFRTMQGQNNHPLIIWIKSGSHARRGQYDNLRAFVTKALEKISEPFHIITSDGDASVLDLIINSTGDRLLRNPLLSSWHSQNAQTPEFIDKHLASDLMELYSSKVRPIPIGLDLHTNRGFGVGNRLLSLFKREVGNRRPCDTRIPKILVDCCTRSASAERQEIGKRLRGLHHIDVLDSRVNQLELWSLYGQYQAVLSLPGYGLDCHRSWEALYLGAHVVGPAVGLRWLYEGLPVTEFQQIEKVCEPEIMGELSGQFSGLRLRPRDWLALD